MRKNFKNNKKPHHNKKQDKRQGGHPKGSQRPVQGSSLKVNMWGWHACLEAWKNPNRNIESLYLTENAAERFADEVKGLSIDAKRPDPQIVDGKSIEASIKGDPVHQGIAIKANGLAEINEKDLLISLQKEEKSLVLMLDQVTDPHNVGAIIRSAAAFGAKGLVVQNKYSPQFDGVLAKIACGGVEHVPLVSAVNLSRAIESFQEEGFCVVGLSEHATASIEDVAKNDKILLVLGAEGPGMRRLVSEKCDFNIALPTQLPIASLNVSNAAAIALYAFRK